MTSLAMVTVILMSRGMRRVWESQYKDPGKRSLCNNALQLFWGCTVCGIVVKGCAVCTVQWGAGGVNTR